MERLRILLNQMVSEKTADVFLNEIRNRPPVLLVKLVQERESLNSLLNQIGISPGLDRVGVITALEIWSKEYVKKEQGPLAIEKEEKQRSMAIIEKEEEQGPLAIEKEEEQGSMAIIEKEEEKSLGTDVNQSKTETTTEFLVRIEIENKEAKNNLIKAGYNLVNDLIRGPPTAEDLNKYGFNDAQRNRIIKSVHDLSQIKEGQSFSWKKPHPLLSTIGSKWDYQRSEVNTEMLEEALQSHFLKWKVGKTDKQLHPLFLALSGAGTGKSRLLQELPKLVEFAISCVTPKTEKEEWTEEERETMLSPQTKQELLDRIRGAYVFLVSFENGTSYCHFDSNGPGAVGTRMLYQLAEKRVDWQEFKKNNDVTPGYVIEILAKSLGIKESDMTVFICVDGIQKLPHVNKSKESTFYHVISSVANLVDSSSTFVIGCCSATVTIPVSEVLADSPQKRIFLTVPQVNGNQIFTESKKYPLLSILIDDMGGNGRALESLSKNWNPEKNVADIMKNIKDDLRMKYPEWVSNAFTLIPVLRAILANQKFESRDQMLQGTNWTVDDICSLGLIRYNDNSKTLCCSYIWMWLLANVSNDLILQHLMSGDYEMIQEHYNGCEYFVPNWKNWESFNVLFRCLKSRIYDNKQEVLFSKVHNGAQLSCGEFSFTNFTLEFAKASYQYPTASGSVDEIKTENGEVRVSDGTHFFLGIGNAAAGDGWCQLKSSPQRREIHQYKLVHNKKLTLDVFTEERKKAAADDDIFLLFCISSEGEWKKSDLPPNSGLVNMSNFQDYYGPFAGRVFSMTAKTLNVNPNELKRNQLLCFPGIGQKRADTIIEQRKKRKFCSIEDMEDRTKIQQKFLQQFQL